MRAIAIILAANIAEYLVVAFLVWDVWWVASIGSMTAGDRFAILLIWAVGTLVGAWVINETTT